MRITPNYLAGLPQPIIEIFYGVEDYIISDIARRIKQMGEATSTAEIQRIVLEAMGTGVDDINTMLSAALDTTEHEIEQLFSSAMRNAAMSDTTWAQQIGKAAAKVTMGDLRNLTNTAGYVMNNGQFSLWTDAYRQTLSTAQLEILSGAVDYNTAIRNALKPYASQGLTTVAYESGRVVSIEAAARQSIMQGARDTIQQMWHDDADRMGADGWELSAHMYCAPDHEPYQGRQYSREEYGELNSSLARRIGTYNCRHVAFPIILGVSEPAYSDAELAKMARKNAEGITYEGKHYTGYEATQMQRRMERSIRKTKREMIGFDESGLKDDFTAASIKLRRQRDYYKDFCGKAGLTPRNDLIQTSGYGRSMSGKALYAEKNRFTYDKNGGIIRYTMDNSVTTKQLQFSADGWIPAGTEIQNVHVIAGKGTDIVLRTADNLAKRYGGNPEDWRKCVGKVISAKYEFDIHWEEHDIIGMVRQKIKSKKDR